jgi:2-polyprenyl-3-methyl-5-hydroxy-6-metoxy-1,4-benzoquinol methylase
MMPETAKEDRSNAGVIRKMIGPLKSRKFVSFPGLAYLKLLAGVTPESISELLELQAPVTSLITLQPEFVALLRSIDDLDPQLVIQKSRELIFLESTGTELVHHLLRKLINVDLSMEHALTALRRAYLQCALARPGSLQPSHIRAMATLASQCFNNEYVFYESAQEAELCGMLAAEINRPGSDAPFVSRVVAYAMYRPLSTLALGEQQILALSQYGGDLKDLIDRQITDDALERQIAPAIPSFSPIEDRTSIKVRQQYEQAPYPRWIEFVFKQRRPFHDYIAGKFPFLGDVPPLAAPDCLVAGCGTGNHALKVATKLQDASVVAVDLSRRSLAYGIRQASRYGVSNIEFLHGDLLQIGALKRDFDLVECIGVLHCLEDPFSGFKALTEVLRPGGFMRIAVYRRYFEDRLTPAKQFVQSRLTSYAPSELRSIRHELCAQNSIDISSSTSVKDFYYTSGFRDLLCPAKETSYTPAEIKQMVQRLDLSFLCIDYADYPALKSAFQAAYPDESSSRDLDAYQEFESSHADQMPPLLEFWVRKMR